MSCILVTGATGFLGSAIVERLLSAGATVRTTARSTRPNKRLPDYRPLDLTKPTHLNTLLSGVHCVVHAAGVSTRSLRGGRDLRDFLVVNAAATERLAEASVKAGVKHFVLVSSMSVYGGAHKSPAVESDVCRPATPYARSKYEGEQRLSHIAGDAGVRATILRFSTIYGETDPGNVARLIRAIDRRRFVWIGRGENWKSLIFRDDAARACALSASASGRGGVHVYNVSAPPCTMWRIVDELADVLRRRVPRLHLPPRAAAAILRTAARLLPAPNRATDWLHVVDKWLADELIDCGKFYREFSFRPLIRLAEGLRREVTWYRHLKEASIRE